MWMYVCEVYLLEKATHGNSTHKSENTYFHSNIYTYIQQLRCCALSLVSPIFVRNTIEDEQFDSLETFSHKRQISSPGALTHQRNSKFYEYRTIKICAWEIELLIYLVLEEIQFDNIQVNIGPLTIMNWWKLMFGKYASLLTPVKSRLVCFHGIIIKLNDEHFCKNIQNHTRVENYFFLT